MTLETPLLTYTYDRAKVATVETGIVDRVAGPFSGYLGAHVRAADTSRVRALVANLPISATLGTWVCFVKFNDDNTFGTDRYLGAWGAPGGNHLALFYRASDDKFVMRSNNGSDDDAVSIAQTFSAGASRMVAGIVTASDVKVRVGTEVTVALGSRAGGAPTLAETTFDFGSDGAGANRLEGVVGVVMFWPRELSSDELDYLAGLLADRPPGAYELSPGNGASEVVARWYGALESIEHGSVFGLIDQPSSTSELSVRNVRGAGMPEIIVESDDSPFRDGAIFNESLLGQRFLTVDLEIYALPGASDSWARLQDLRGLLLGALNPSNGIGLITYTPDDVAYVIEAIHSGGGRLDDLFLDRFHRISLEFQCPDPAWRLAIKNMIRISAAKGGVSIPLAIPLSITATGATQAISNAGPATLAARPLFRVHGQVENPTITNETTGKVVSFATTVAADRVLEIDMDALTAALDDGTNEMGNRTANSEFWDLVRGANDINVAFLNGVSPVVVDVIYDTRVIGI